MRYPVIILNLAVVLICLPPDADADDRRPLKYLSLPAAIDVLQREGMTVLYSSDLVTEKLLVEKEPESDTPQDALREILRSHDLALEAGPQGTLVIIRNDHGETAATGTILGVVKSRESGNRVSGADVVLKGRRTRRDTTSGSGLFQFSDIKPGSYTLIVRDDARYRISSYQTTVEAGFYIREGTRV